MGDPIKIDGLNQFARNLRKIDSDLPKMLRVSFNTAADLVVQDARPRVPKKSGRAAASIKARSTRTAVRVSAGGGRAKHYPWLDFGGAVGPRRSIRRPFLKEGRYIYRSFYDLRAAGRFQQVMTKALLDVVKAAGVEVD